VIVELSREYHFEAAHRLPRVPEGHKCSRVHGHSYKVVLNVRGKVDPQSGWLIDFGALDDVFAARIHSRLDHRYLNDIPGLENSTCEILAGFIWNEVRQTIPELSAVTVWETIDASCTYRGED
jgi:6-pyruvoyltetrahydropterin/6-carboxytetrahydropterin synthase